MIISIPLTSHNTNFLMIFFFILLSLFSAKRYKDFTIIPVYGTKVSPYNNPFETHDFYSIPFCPYTEKETKTPRRLSDAFLGNNLQRTSVSLKFKMNETNQQLCQITLNHRTKEKFQNAIKRHFYYQLDIDKLPVWSLIGAKGNQENSNQSFVFTKQHFTVYYNENRIISVSLTPENPVSLDSNTLNFTYSVYWHPTSKTKAQRIQNYSDLSFFVKSNTLMNFAVFLFLILLMIFAILFTLTRYVADDFKKIKNESQYNDFEIDFRSAKGWKMIHADVFRHPRHSAFLSILCGTGAQIFTALLMYLEISYLFWPYFNSTTYFNVIILCYSIASLISGYFSAGLYKRWGGDKWIPQLIATTFFVPSLFFTAEFALDFISLFYGYTKLSKIKPYIVLFLVLIFIILPLTLIGGIFGRHWFILGPNPGRVGLISRNIPRQPFYLNNYFVSFVVGLLSFLSVFAQIHSLLNSIAQFQVDIIWMIALVVLLLLASVVACLTLSLVYLKLSAENYLWHWISFTAPFSISFFIFGYSIYYCMKYTAITSYLHAFYFFSYALVLSLIVGVICGFIGFCISALFVRKMYTIIKSD